MKAASHILGFVGMLYTEVALAAWCLVVFFFFAMQADATSLLPALIWSYCIASGPISWMAQKAIQAGDGQGALMSALLTQIAYIVAIAGAVFLDFSPISIFFVFLSLIPLGILSKLYIQLHPKQESLLQ